MSEKRLAARDQILRGLIAFLPESGVWTQREREEWLALFIRLVDYTVAVVPATAIPGEVKAPRGGERHE